MIDANIEPDRCLICGEFMDYCLGHGPDTELDFWDSHEAGDHTRCNKLACEEANHA
ncbi:hypothetical protein PBI_LAMBO_59 [Gordonia phage Lambo]|uniref:Uncharacterized protein n=11 Tax=Lambovirus TaxID=2843412 RepID=A0A9E7TN44_9CAUD|nr:hypothetical protein HWC68_gp63 [Gordonia phage Gibbin]YP_009852513.1 hypothetical protein HWC69_gp061 [Gordonia phage Ranch]YP_009852612.1 hypothetical protein HWC70_gp59 [Gordonia phage Lambo]YP_009852713.1 hypothetical protein HWC71_gp62 [Gordonia phage Sadboi]YP_009854017.1 hypothetical protein HWC82_gp63 [Gordonia phage Yikes]QFG08199.1 hypothetical protein PBI_GRETELLYN_61 [Gordonia phage GretelLyn]UJQ86753.1 hypothetical protein SEA_JALEBI_60 [Gordonia phage Jalebi]UVF61584.1 hypot